MKKNSDPKSYKARNIGRSAGPKWKLYTELMTGETSLVALIKYELIVCFVGSIPGALGLALRRVLYPLVLKDCGRNIAFGKSVTIRHGSKVRVGDNVIIDDYSVIDAKGTTNTGIDIGSNVFIGRNTVIYCKNGDISIGDNVNIGINCDIYAKNRVGIGKDTMVAAYCYVMSGGQYDYQSKTPFFEQDSFSRGPTLIGQNCWLGAKALIQDGVSVGDGAVVGAGAVVTKDVPAGRIATGVPARVKG